jgi:hypothetical protein
MEYKQNNNKDQAISSEKPKTKSAPRPTHTWPQNPPKAVRTFPVQAKSAETPTSTIKPTKNCSKNQPQTSNTPQHQTQLIERGIY